MWLLSRKICLACCLKSSGTLWLWLLLLFKAVPRLTFCYGVETARHCPLKLQEGHALHFGAHHESKMHPQVTSSVSNIKNSLLTRLLDPCAEVSFGSGLAHNQFLAFSIIAPAVTEKAILTMEQVLYCPAMGDVSKSEYLVSM